MNTHAQRNPATSTELARMNHPTLPASIGRYLLYQPIARGGMATVHAARFVAAEGVTRLVAAKRLHPHFTDDPEFVEMFHDEARIASRIHHPNVVPVLDVILDGEEVILIQEYVHGVPLSYLFKQALAASETIPRDVALTIVTGILAGLHAAHEATDDCGDPLGVVHRDVSPQNIIVSVDGIPRLVDFGIAKAKSSTHHTREGFFKGKLAYMAPEQLRAEPVTRRADIYSAGVLLWELLVNRRFYDGKNDADFVRQVALGSTPTPTQALESERTTISEERWADISLLEPIVVRALSAAPEGRYATAAEMAAALLAAGAGATPMDLATWVRARGVEYLEKRQRILASADESSRTGTGSRQFEHARLDDGMKSSGARMRLAVTPIGNDIHPSSEPPSMITEPTAATALAASRLDRVGTRSLVPWTVVGALLVIVGLLGGMVLVRDPSPARAQPAAVAADAPALPVVATAAPVNPATAPLPATATAPAPASAPAPPAAAAAATHVAIEPEPSSSSTAAATSAQPRPPVRWVAPARPAPVVARPAPVPTSQLTAASAATAKDCNPPFYFEGNKKVFKPSCL